MKNFSYFAPHSLDEALFLLEVHQQSAKILAGGTDLIVQMKDGLMQPEVIIDVKHIPELNCIELKRDGTLSLGASVPLNKLLAYAATRQYFFILHQACSCIGSMQLKNRATVGGNICNAAPSADTAPALLCLGARALIANKAKQRSVPIGNFFQGPGKTALASDELLLGLEIPPIPGPAAGYYLRHTPRQDMDISVAGVAGLVTFADRGDTCSEARIALGAVAPTPIRVTSAEALLKGERLTDTNIGKAAEMTAAAATPISDIRSSAEYRHELVRVLTRRVLQACLLAYERKKT